MPDLNGKPKHYLNGVQILGTPKTVDLAGQVNGNALHGPLEVWVAAIVATMDAEQKARFATIFEACMRQRELQRGLNARVVADIVMPNIHS